MIEKQLFKDALSLAHGFSSSEIDKPQISGVLFEFEPGVIRLIATDAKVITVIELRVENSPAVGSFMLYRAYVEKLLKTMLKGKKLTGEIGVIYTGPELYFSDSSGAIEVFSAPAVEFPDYRSALRQPEQPPESVTMNAGFITKAIIAMQPLQGGRTGVTIKLFDGGPNYFTPALEPGGPVLSCFVAIMGFGASK